MAEQKPKPKPTNKKEEKKKDSSKSVEILVNILIGVALLSIIAVGFLLATGKIKLDFLYGDNSTSLKSDSELSDSLTLDSLNATGNDGPDFGIERIDSGNTTNSGNASSAFGEVPKSPDGRSHVIAGVFYNKMLCDRQVVRLRAKGLTPKLLPFTSSGGNTFYRISVFSSESADAANAKRDEISNSVGVDCWVLE